jgi:hypothetical protein
MCQKARTQHEDTLSEVENEHVDEVRKLQQDHRNRIAALERRLQDVTNENIRLSRQLQDSTPRTPRRQPQQPQQKPQQHPVARNQDGSINSSRIIVLQENRADPIQSTEPSKQQVRKVRFQFSAETSFSIYSTHDLPKEGEEYVF